MWKGHEKVKVGVRSTEALVQKEEEDVKQLGQQAPNQIGKCKCHIKFSTN